VEQPPCRLRHSIEGKHTASDFDPQGNGRRGFLARWLRDTQSSKRDWIRLLRANGFDIEDLIEAYPPNGSTTSYPLATLEWAQAWPCEEVWKVRQRG
jgi:hypothetical protein